MGVPSVLVAPGEAAPRRDALGIAAAAPVLAVIGTTSDLDVELDAQLLPVVLAAVDVVARTRGVIVTGGTDAGVLHLVRLAVAVAPRPPAGIVGVAPDGLVTTADDPSNTARVGVDPGLTALVRVKGDQWGDETPMFSRVVSELAVPGRLAVLLVGGGEITRLEVKEHLRLRRRIIVLAGSGRLADEIAAGAAGRDDEELGILLSSGDVRTIALSAGADALRKEITTALGGERARPDRASARRRGKVLLSVFPKLSFHAPPSWPLLPAEARSEYPQLADSIEEADRFILPAFAECDQQALREQNRWRWFTVLAIGGGFFTTVFGAVQAWLQSALWPGVIVVSLGATSSALTTVARRQGSLQQFLSARLRAERLRSLYFEQIATAACPPAGAGAASPDQQRRNLERRVAEIQYSKVSS